MHKIALYGVDGHPEVISSAATLLPGVELVAVAEPKPEMQAEAKALAGVTPKTKFYSDWRKMMDSEKFDILGVASESDQHVEPILAAAARGINVVADKPVALDRKGLAAVRAAVEKSGIAFTTIFDMRTCGPYAAVREAVRAGGIGKPVLIFAQKSYRIGARPSWMQRRATFGGIMPYIGCHMLDLAMWTTGLDVARVAAWHGNAGKPEVGEMEDHAAAVFEMTGGAALAMTLDYLRPSQTPTHGDARLRIAGSEGVIEVKDLEARVELITNSAPARNLPFPSPVNIVADWIESLDGKREHVIKQSEIWRVTEVLIAAQEAADTGTVKEV